MEDPIAMSTDDLIMNAFTTRADLLSKLFDPRRDIDDECGYPKSITDKQYRRMYDRGLGRRVVDIYPSETWKEFPAVYEDADPDVNTPFEIAFDAVNKRHRLLHFLQRADELSGIGRYGVILWGFNDGKPLSEPVDGFETWSEATGEDTPIQAIGRKLIFIRVLDESLVTIKAYERDITSPRYGLPTKYEVSFVDAQLQQSGNAAVATSVVNTTVHWSRITHIADNRKTSEVFGTPRMEPVWNRLYDLRKVLSGSGEMFWRGGFPGLSLETQPGFEGAELDEEATRKMMFDYMNGLQRYLALVGMSAKSMSPQIADPSNSFKVQIQAICVTIGVPFRVFMGIEEGVVSGDQATRAWEARLANRQARYITPMIINPALQRLVSVGVLPPTAEPMGWTVEWPDMGSPTASEQADIANKKTEAFSKYIAGSVDTLIPPMEYLTLICGLSDDVAQNIIEAAIDHIGVDTPGDSESAVRGEFVAPVNKNDKMEGQKNG